MFYTTNKQIETYRDHLVEMVRICEENIFNLKISREEMENLSEVKEVNAKILQQIGLRMSYQVALESFNGVFPPNQKELNLARVMFALIVAFCVSELIILFI